MIKRLLSSNAFALPRLRIWIHALLGGRRPLDAFIGLLAAGSALLLILSSLLWVSDQTTPSFKALEEEAQRALSRKDIETARVCILRLRNLVPDEPGSVVLQAQLLQLLGNHDEAVFLLRSLMQKEGETSVNARSALAEALLLGPRPDTAAGLAHLEKALAEAPKSPRVHEVAARVALVREDWPQVLTHLDQTPLASRPDLRLMQAIALWNSGETERAAQLCREIEELRLRQIAALDERPEFDELMAAVLGLQGEFARALAWVPSGSDVNPAWIRNRCDLLSALAGKLASGPFPKWLQALERLEEALQLDNSHRPSLRAFAKLSLQVTADSEVDRDNQARLESGGTDSMVTDFSAWYAACRALQAGDQQGIDASLNAAMANPQTARLIGHLAWSVLSEQVDDPGLLDLLLNASRKLATSHAASLASPELEGRLLVATGRFSEASFSLRQAFNEGSTRLSDTVQVTRDVWERLALDAWSEGNRARAHSLFADAYDLALDRGRLERNLALGSALYDELDSDWAKALEGLERFATDEDRKHPEWDELRGLLKYRLGQPGEIGQWLDSGRHAWGRSYPKPAALSELYDKLARARLQPETW
jgi:hypothetical protein